MPTNKLSIPNWSNMAFAVAILLSGVGKLIKSFRRRNKAFTTCTVADLAQEVLIPAARAITWLEQPPPSWNKAQQTWFSTESGEPLLFIQSHLGLTRFASVWTDSLENRKFCKKTVSGRSKKLTWTLFFFPLALHCALSRCCHICCNSQSWLSLGGIFNL